MDSEAQHSTKLRAFDPSEHGADVAQAFQKFIRLYKRKYKAWDRKPPTDTENADQWKSKDKLRQLLGHYSTDRLMDDFEAVATEEELENGSFDVIINRLHDRYKPNTNQTMSHYKFHRLHQSTNQSFDSFVNSVKNEAKNCNFKCQSDTCNVSETLLPDQIIIGVTDEDLRKNALKEEWTLQQLEDHGRRTEAAALGAAALTDNNDYANISKTAGKYSKKYRKKEKLYSSKKDSQYNPPKKDSFVCFRCGRNRCNQDYCPTKRSTCHLCKEKGHWAGSLMCPGKSEKTEENIISTTKIMLKLDM